MQETLAADLPGKTEVAADEDALVSNDTPAHGRMPIPTAVKHQVWLRDDGKCTWVSEEGRRYQARPYLQIDHIKMVCLGGSNDVDNLRLLCSSHNRLAYALHEASRLAAMDGS